MISQTSATNGAAIPEVPKRADQMGRDAFLHLLTTQLAHQDPTAPQDNAQMITQLAQFSSLEQLTQIQQTLESIATAFGVSVPSATASTERNT